LGDATMREDAENALEVCPSFAISIED